MSHTKIIDGLFRVVITFTLISSLLPNTLFASIISPESLFRNGSNQEIKTNTVRIDYIMREVQSTKEIPTFNAVQTGNYITSYFNLEHEKSLRYLQIIYNDKTIPRSNQFKLYYHPNFLSNLKKRRDLDENKHLIYATLISLVLNKSDALKEFLKNKVPLFQDNSKVLNRPKKNILERYVNYLSAVKEDETLKDVLTSPLTPEKEEDKERVGNLLKEEMYKKTASVRLIKKDQRFLISLDYPNFKALFSNKKHQLQTYSYINESGAKFQVECYKYILFNGTHELPKHLVIKTTDGKIYTIQFVKLYHYNEKPYNFPKKYQEKRKELSKLNIDITEPFSPSLLF